jgi:predicted kinase
MGPLLLIMAGTTGSGKTTVSEMLSLQIAPCRRLESDVIRKKLHGIAPDVRADCGAIFDGIYSKESTRATYEEMLGRARLSLNAGYSVILDAGFRTRQARSLARQVGAGVGVITAVVQCTADHADQEERVRRRYAHGRSASDGRPEVLRAHRSEWEQVRRWEADLILRIDTSVPIPRLQRKVAECRDLILRVAAGVHDRPGDSDRCRFV